MKNTLMTACLISIIGSAHADPAPPLPQYDVVATCEATAKRLNVDPSMLSQCVSSSYGLRELVAYIWENMAPSLRAQCIKANEFNDYSELMLCLEGHKRDSQVMGK
jgi:hypothetical protein